MYIAVQFQQRYKDLEKSCKGSSLGAMQRGVVVAVLYGIMAFFLTAREGSCFKATMLWSSKLRSGSLLPQRTRNLPAI